MERVRRGEQAAFAVLVEHHLKQAFAIAYRLLGHREDAEDLVQDAFLLALRGLDGFEPGRAFGPWFFRILVNRGLNRRRDRARQRTEPIPSSWRRRRPRPHCRPSGRSSARGSRRRWPRCRSASG